MRGPGVHEPGFLRSRSLTAIVGMVSLVVNVAASWVPSLWADEGATVSGATRSLPELWRLIQTIDAVHATYYALLNPWLQVAGVSPTSLRLPSAVAAAAAAMVLHRVALRLLDPTSALTVAAVFIVLPRVTWMGIEARSSAFSSLVALLLTWLVVRTTRTPRISVLLGYAGLAALGIALHVYLALLFGVHLALLLIRRERPATILRWGVAAGVGVLLASPLIRLSLGQTGQVGGGFGLDPLVALRQMAVNQYFLGESPLDTGDPLRDMWQYAAVLLAVLTYVLIIVAFFVSRSDPESNLDVVVFAVIWAFLPSLTVLLGSLAAGNNLYHPRYFAFCAAGLALLIGWAVGRLASIWARITVWGLLLLLVLPIYASQRGVNAKTGADWSEVIAMINESASAGDGIIYTGTNRIISIAYPGALDEYRDLTLLVDPIADASLAGRSRALQDSLVDAPDVVWVIYRLDRDEEPATRAILEKAGYRPFRTWRGTWDWVVGYRR